MDTKLKNQFAALFLITLGLTLGACTSSQVAEGEGEEAIAEADAGTDAIPQPSVEQASTDEAPPTPAAEEAPPAPAEETAHAEAPASEPAPAPVAEAPASAPETPAAAPAPEAPVPTEVAQVTPPASAPETSHSETFTSDSGGSTSYTVQSGDTLMKIAFDTYGDLYQWKRIYEANRDKIKDPNVIPKGIVLKIDAPSSPKSVARNGERYEIKQGETLGTISQDIYGTKTKWKKIWENNKELIKDPNKIFAGFNIYYTMTPEEREESERLKKDSMTPAPLANNNPESSSRVPASVEVPAAGAPQAQAAQ